MFSTALPILPPPSTSLLPPLYAPPSSSSDSASQHLSGILHHQHHHHHLQHQHQRRVKHGHLHTRSAIQSLSLDERTIAQRKMAIAMYGYSWLKPAGCTKTMLGRREEELEREEVERQLREVELQERAAAEGEAEAEAERLAEMRRLELEAETAVGSGLAAGRPGAAADGERDLDDDIPEAISEAEEDEDDLGSEEGLGDEGDGMDADLDDEIPDADTDQDPDADVESSWVYDTTRDPDSDADVRRRGPGARRHQTRREGGSGFSSSPAYTGTENAVETEAMVNAMLDEDELGEMELHRDLDDDVPDMDAEDMDVDMDVDDQDRDLDDDVPEADDEGEWQHTDTELEESDMDISILPAGPRHEQQQQQQIHQLQGRPPGSGRSRRSGRSSSSIGPGTTHEEMRRSSGNMMMPPPLPGSTQPQPVEVASSEYAQQERRVGWTAAPRGRPARNITPQARSQYHTPGTNTGDSVSNLISTNGSSVMGTGMSSTGVNDGQDLNQHRTGRSWLNPAAARRNLFGGLGRASSNPNSSATSGTSTRAAAGGTSDGSGFTPETSGTTTRGTRIGSSQTQVSSHNNLGNATSSSSGGLFTPSPRVVNTAGAARDPRQQQRQHQQLRHGQTGRAAAGELGEQDQDQEPEPEPEAPRSRTRSGRLMMNMSSTIGSVVGRRLGGGGEGGGGEQGRARERR